ncbi:RDD family protein [Caldalkalibacillus mannanilyticus]|uniref:RDD family protein n=1 Tax=Caldalkalibacillus mannanilyticus TaxID=1418 RepID=UPI00046AFC67|nr:RDD family protein [Caldalkalibacillus mannanilyticus]
MTQHWQNKTSVVTPEHVQLQFKTAGIGSRVAAHVIDVLIIAVISIVAYIALLVTILTYDGAEWIQGYIISIVLIALAILLVGYFIIMEYANGGQTVGKKVMGIRVIQENGQALTFLSSVLRNFFRIIDMLPSFYFLGGLVSFFHSKEKRIGDMIAGTIVVLDEGKIRQKDKEQKEKLLQKRAATIPTEWCLTEYQKQHIKIEDWKLLNSFIERLSTLTKEKEEEYSKTIAAHFIKVLDLEYSSKTMEASTSFLLALYQQLKDEWEV